VFATVVAPAAAQTQEREAIAVVGLTLVEQVDGKPAVRVEEPQRRRERVAGALRAPDRPVLDHAELRDILGAGYLTELVACRGEPACVAGIAAPLGARVRLAVYGEYEVEGEAHRFWLRAVDVRDRRLVAESRFTLQVAELEDEARWRRELSGLLAQATGKAPAPSPNPGGDPVQQPPPDGEPPELPPLDTGEPTGTTDGGDGKPATGGSALEALARGVVWHGYLQLYAAVGVREPFRPDLVVFENRLQLELKSDVGPLRIVGRPELVFDGLREELDVSFRELFAARDYEKLELSIGERILTWGVTDFWPVVDILNPRSFSPIRNWRPIDEKRPAPVVQATAVLGRVTLQAIGIILARSSTYQLDQTRPFAIPIAVPPGIPISQEPVPRSLRSSGGGVAADVTLGHWKTSLYALWGRDPLPTIFARVDPMTGAPEVRVENERVAMVAASARGTIDRLDALIKTEAAYYRGSTTAVRTPPRSHRVRRAVSTCVGSPPRGPPRRSSARSSPAWTRTSS
jgi:hypothetical protein